jgi:SAM-dependent methyltransferase
MASEKVQLRPDENYWDQFYQTRKGRYLGHCALQFLESLQLCVPVLERGCGGGRITRPLVERFGARSVIGVDIEQDRVLKVSSLVPGVRLIQADALALPLAHASMQAVIAIEVALYFRDKKSFFSECRRVLAPGGMLVVQLQNACSYRGVFYQWKRSRSPFPFFDLSWRTIKALLCEAGFRVVQARGYNWIPVTNTHPNNPLLGLYASCERLLRLQDWISFSPWLLIAAQKQ